MARELAGIPKVDCEAEQHSTIRMRSPACSTRNLPVKCLIWPFLSAECIVSATCCRFSHDFESQVASPTSENFVGRLVVQVLHSDVSARLGWQISKLVHLDCQTSPMHGAGSASQARSPQSCRRGRSYRTQRLGEVSQCSHGLGILLEWQARSCSTSDSVKGQSAARRLNAPPQRYVSVYCNQPKAPIL